MFEHHYLLALKVLQLGRASLVSHFSANEDLRDWELLNRIIASTSQTDEIIRKIFFVQSTADFLKEAQGLHMVTESDFSERNATSADLENVERAIRLYLNISTPVDIKQKLSQLELQQCRSLLDSSESLDRKVARMKNIYLLEKSKFEKRFQYYSQKKGDDGESTETNSAVT